MKSDKRSYIIYGDPEYLFKNIYQYGNNLEKSSTAKIDEHIPCGYLISTICASDNMKNKHS